MLELVQGAFREPILSHTVAIYFRTVASTAGEVPIQPTAQGPNGLSTPKLTMHILEQVTLSTCCINFLICERGSPIHCTRFLSELMMKVHGKQGTIAWPTEVSIGCCTQMSLNVLKLSPAAPKGAS